MHQGVTACVYLYVDLCDKKTRKASLWTQQKKTREASIKLTKIDSTDQPEANYF